MAITTFFLVLFSLIDKLHLQEFNQEIGKIKADRVRDNIEYESLLAQVEYTKKYPKNVESTKRNKKLSNNEISTVLNMTTDEKTEVKHTIEMMVSIKNKKIKQNIRR